MSTTYIIFTPAELDIGISRETSDHERIVVANLYIFVSRVIEFNLDVFALRQEMLPDESRILQTISIMVSLDPTWHTVISSPSLMSSLLIASTPAER